MTSNQQEPEHLRIVNCFLPQHGDGLEGILEYGIDDAAAIEANIIYMSPITNPGGISTYGLGTGHINPALIKGEYATDHNRNLMHALLRKANKNDISVSFDLVLNHISKDSALFYPERLHELKYDPVLGKSAASIARGKYTADDMFAPVDVKRHDEAKPWNDVREIRLDSEEHIQRAIDDIILPLVDMHLDLIPPEMQEAVFRVDTPSQLLLTNRPNDEGYAVYKIFDAINTRCKERNLKPKFLMETLGGHQGDYQKILASVPEEVRNNTYCFSDAMYGLSDKNFKMEYVRNDVAGDNRHDYFRKLQMNKSLYGNKLIAIAATHDTAKDGNDIPNAAKRDEVSPLQIKRNVNFASALSFLSSPSYMMTYAMVKKDYGYKQPLDTECSDTDFRSDNDTPMQHMAHIAQTHKQLYKNRSSFAWNEVAIDPNDPDHSVMIFWSDYEQKSPPVFVVHNANPDAVDLPNNRDLTEFVKTVAQANAERKGYAYQSPQEVHMTGEFTPKQLNSMAHDNKMIRVNGQALYSITHHYQNNAEDTAATGTFGMVASGAHYSPNPP